MESTTMRIGSTALAALGALLLPGCVSYSTIKDEPRTEVRFVSAKATEVFYRAYRDPVPEKKHSVYVQLTPPLPYWQSSKDSDNIRFNRAVAKADANHNGVITEKEAAAFAEKETEDLKTSDARPEGGGAGV